MVENEAGESTKKTLIVTVGVVMVVSIVTYLTWQYFKDRVKCQDGSTQMRINPEEFVLQYAGKRITGELDFKEKIKQSVSVEDTVLQQAIEATQLLDQRLRFVIVDYNVTICDPEGKALLRKLNKLKSDDLVRLAAIQQELNAIAERTKSAQPDQVQALLQQQKTVADTGSADLK